jgi:hypothetical protein
MRCSVSEARDSESEKWKQKMLGESQPESGWIMGHDHVLSSDSVRKDGNRKSSQDDLVKEENGSLVY